jgi:GAF domain-containing protein
MVRDGPIGGRIARFRPHGRPRCVIFDSVSQTGDDATRLRALLDIAKVIGASRTEDLVEALAESARRALDGASLSISRWDRERGVLKTIVNVGMLAPGEVRFPTDETFALASWPEVGGLVQGRMSFVTRLGDGTPEGGHLAQLGKTSGLSAPILVEARVWGEMWVARAEGQPAYTEDDLDFAEAIGEVQEVQTSYSERLQSADDQDEAESLREEARDEMIGAVKDTGLTLDEYNLIAQRLQTDPALAERVRGLGAVE